MNSSSVIALGLVALLASAGCKPLVDSCPEADFHVSEGAVEGDGSEARPFPTIAAALSAAPSVADSCEVVTIRLQGGVHHESVTLSTRALSLMGEGTEFFGNFNNPGGATLAIERLQIRQAPQFGVRQVGGELLLRSVTISGTTLSQNDPGSGTALRISGGAFVELDVVTLEQNSSQALSADGEGTRVSASLLIVRNNGVHPLVQQSVSSGNSRHLGAIEIQGGTAFSGRSITVRDNAGVGVAVTDGSSAFLARSTLQGTHDVNFGSGPYSANLRVKSSEVELNQVDTTDTFVGVHVIDSKVTYLRGNVSRNGVGMAFHETDGFVHTPSNYNPLMCIDRVAFRENDTPTQFDLLPIPESGPVPAAYCARVALGVD
ncbi:MAG: hypothetical protein IT285_09595 [Bdellovibrionales bacterium]|nr:hypothetical protein [Bdellovibrionales bacterium]